MSLIQVYAPINEAKDEDKEAFTTSCRRFTIELQGEM